jgi:ABC-2 type transport system ATP-binding protein
LDPVAQPEEVRHQFGIVFQDPSLDQDLTARENMELHGVLYGVPRTPRRERTEMLLKLFDLWERRDGLVKEFSGGMKRRLEIARGLLHTPMILFLDEPTLGLDPQSRNQLWTQVRRRIVAVGSPHELKDQTRTASLEEAFLALTGASIRDDSPGAADQMRQWSAMWRRRG